MIKQRSQVNALFVYIADIILAVAAFYAGYLIRGPLAAAYGPWVGLPPLPPLAPIEQYNWLLLFVIPAWTVSLYLAGAYRNSCRGRLLDELPRVWLGITVAVVMLIFVIFVFKSVYLSRLFVAAFWAAAVVLTTVSRALISWWFSYTSALPRNVRNVVIVGTGPRAVELAGRIKEHKNWSLNLLGFVKESALGEEAGPVGAAGVPCLGTVGEMDSIVRGHVIDEVIFVTSKERLESLEDVFLFLEDEGINARLELNIFKRVISRVSLEELDGVPLLTFTTTPTNELALAVKRVFDVVVSASALVLLAPLIALIAAVICLTSKGPPIFVQTRSGINGREFRLYKFRSMRMDNQVLKKDLKPLNELDGPVFKIRRDPRVTLVGRFLRRLSLDELPQLYNVLKGEMSMVGPRPPLPEEVAGYERWQRRRLSMKPGLTCIWQVSGRNSIRFQDWMKLDLLYIDNWSLWLDLKILFKTIPAVLSGRGAY